MNTTFKRIVLHAAMLTGATVLAAETIYELAPIVVTGDLLNSPVDRLPSSATILRGSSLEATGEQHFEELLGRIPNLNWAGGTSRPRYFQIRGIGENSQFGNEIPASSVGFMIDGIDFTGIATVAGLFDVEQVEVLRGPQAAAFGANAMAGMVLVTTNPTSSASGRIEASAGNDGFLSTGVATGGSILNSGISFRASLHHHQSNGFRDNQYLNRDDTNGRDEWSSRLKLHWNPIGDLSFDLTLMYFDFDNGYDAWALDNDSFNTSTDEPGEDNQQTVAAGLKALYQISDGLDLSYTISATDSELLYSYDWDWSNPEELRENYGDEVYWGSDTTDRTRDVWSHDLRLSSDGTSGGWMDAWVAGVYFREFQEEQAYFGIDSDYGTETLSIYAQGRFVLGEDLAITLAGRIEEFEIDYFSVNPWGESGPLVTSLGSKEHPWGGKLAMEYTPDEENLFYVSIDRGYKAGGINLDDEVPTPFRIYGTESLINYELGWRGFFLESALRTRLTLFYMDRSNIQVDSSVQLGDGNTFALYKDNAASGHNYGLELESEWRASDRLQFFLSLGLLNTRYDEYSYVDPANPDTEIVLDGAEQAYAPAFNYSIGANYQAGNGLFLNASIEGKDSYLFDTLNQQALEAFNLVRIRAGYKSDEWLLAFWISNLLNEQYDVRGFYFANEPPYYDAPKKWVTQGSPRQWGISLRREF